MPNCSREDEALGTGSSADCDFAVVRIRAPKQPPTELSTPCDVSLFATTVQPPGFWRRSIPYECTRPYSGFKAFFRQLCPPSCQCGVSSCPGRHTSTCLMRNSERGRSSCSCLRWSRTGHDMSKQVVHWLSSTCLLVGGLRPWSPPSGSPSSNLAM